MKFSVFLFIALLGVVPLSAKGQNVSDVAKVDLSESGITQNWRGQTELRLQLSQGVPFRVFTLNDPERLIMDFRKVDWSGVPSDALLGTATVIDDLRFGVFQPGWSRLVADLAYPSLPEEISMKLDNDTGSATLSMVLDRSSPEAFAEAAGVPDDVLWPIGNEVPPMAPVEDDQFVVVIDPGHGGVDPGAEREGLSEKELMLEVAFELRDVLQRSEDVVVVLTREIDQFVSLESRVALTHRAGGDLFLSLHADALSQGGAQGATVYLLSQEASDSATAYLAARHNRADIIAGADLTGSDDQVTGILLDLARQETEPRSAALAWELVNKMKQAGGPMNSRPLRRAGFSVLKSADIPSVLVEVGFLSSERDLNNLTNAAWRSRIVEAIAHAILDWRNADEANRPLVRQ